MSGFKKAVPQQAFVKMSMYGDRWADRFLLLTKRVDGRASDPRLGHCIEWQGGKDKDGYGKVSLKNRSVRPHRVAFEMLTGDSPADRFVCHKCDNPACVRPEHLFLGDAVSNALDMRSKDRHFKNIGERHGNAKLTEEMVKSVRACYVPRKTSFAKLARRFGVSRSAIHLAVTGINWKHV